MRVAPIGYAKRILMIHKILVPLDCSAMAETALPVARKMALENSAEVVLFHSDYPKEMSTLSEIEKAERSHAVSYMQDTFNKENIGGLRVTTAMRDGITAHDAILEYAERNAVDAIVMSTHGRTGAAALVIGSTADKVVKACPIMVVLVRPFQPDAAGEPTVERMEINAP